jgi:hypothetical protein
MFTQAQIEAITTAFREALYNIAGQFPTATQPTPTPESAATHVAQSPVPVPVPVPVPATAVTWSSERGYRVDDIVPVNTPGTRRLLKTGHVLSTPLSNAASPIDGEMFPGYCFRVYKQAGGTVEAASEVMVKLMGGMTESLFEKFGGYAVDGSNWHLAADKYFNAAAYMTPEQLAAEDAKLAAWDKWGVDVKQHQGEMRALAARTPKPPEGERPRHRNQSTDVPNQSTGNASQDVPVGS